MDNSYQLYRSRSFFPSLDGIRCISILLVLWHHCTPIKPSSLPLLSRGFLGVDMFFVLSGYLITTLLLREKDLNGTISLNRFYMRRTLRIFPIYYLLLLVISLGYLFKLNDPSADAWLQSLPYLLSYTSNWVHSIAVMGVAWSLATEEQFYLVWPWVEKYLHRITVPLMIGFILFNQLINFHIAPFIDFGPGGAYKKLEILQITFTPICLGVLLAHLLHKESFFKSFSNLFKNPFSQLLLAITTLLILNFPAGDIAGVQRLTIQTLFALLIALCVVFPEHPFKTILENRFALYFGSISYGLYLYHIIVLSVLNSLFGSTLNPWTLFFLYLVLTTVVSHLSFKYIEKPFLRLKKYFSSSYQLQTEKIKKR